MPRTVIRFAAVCVVALVVAACTVAGDAQPGNVILAVAFGLDDVSPAMTAYVGDPAEAPFRLPAGRYYIEALDSDDVLISSGAQDLEEGDAVQLPTPHEDQTSVRSDGRAEPLITIASFLFDVQLARYEYFDIVTGRFSATPFDSALDLDADDFLPLMARISEIGDQGGRVLDALQEIEARADVTLGSPFVRPAWAADRALERGRMLALRACVLAAFLHSESTAHEMKTEVSVAVSVAFVAMAEKLGAQADSTRKTPEKSEGLCDKMRRWEEYAKGQGGNLSQLEQKIRADLKALLPAATDKQLDEWTKSHMAEIREALGQPLDSSVSTARPMGAMSAYWQAMGCSESEAQVALDSLSQCVTNSADADASFNEILQKCPFSAYEPECASAENGESETDESTAAGSGQQETASLDGEEVTAVGRVTGTVPEECEFVTSNITLRFNTAGGPGSILEGSEGTIVALHHDGAAILEYSTQIDFGYDAAYSPDARELGGVAWAESEHVRLPDNVIGGMSGKMGWSAKWEDSRLVGVIYYGLCPFDVAQQTSFELTVQD